MWSAPDRLDQVLDNLLANALEVAPPASRITLVGVRSDELVELHVVDQGPGLSPQDRERAFDRFWQGATPGDGQGGGFGLGLAIVRQLLATDGGSIELRPRPARGSTSSCGSALSPPTASASYFPRIIGWWR